MNIFRFDKVVLIKEFGSLKKVGETYEVANITDTAVVLRDSVSKIAIGAIDINDFEQYFRKVEDVAKEKKWSAWQGISDTSGNVTAFYRTNFKKVQVKTVDNIHAEACCNKCDEFNLAFGIRVAYERCTAKYLRKIHKEYEDTLKKIDSDIIENGNNIKRMINSHYKTEEE